MDNDSRAKQPIVKWMGAKKKDEEIWCGDRCLHIENSISGGVIPRSRASHRAKKVTLLLILNEGVPFFFRWVACDHQMTSPETEILIGRQSSCLGRTKEKTKADPDSCPIVS